MEGNEKNLEIECGRLRLRSLSIEEMERLQSGKSDRLQKSVLTEVIKSALIYKTEQMRKTPKEAHPWLNYWLIQEKESGRGVGLIGSKHLPDENGYVELGYAIAKECRNRGFMTEALDGFLDWLFGWDFCSGATLSIRESNVPSLRVAEKCGFLYEKKQDAFRVYRYDFL